MVKTIIILRMFISIVIPAFNERERLPATLNSFIDYLEQTDYKWEILVVDDGSTDGTPDLIKETFHDAVKVIVQPKNMGKGAAVRAGVLCAQGEQVLFSDADGSTPITELPKLQNEISKGSDLAIGSRKEAVLIGVKQPFYRIWMGKLFNLIVRILIGGNVQDTQCGFKLIKGDLGRELFAKMKVNGFSFDVELIYLTIKQQKTISEVPVLWLNDARSKVQIWKDPIIMFLELFQIRLLHL